MVQDSDKKDIKSLKDAPMPPLPFAHQIRTEDQEPKGKFTLSEALNKIKEMQKFNDEIEKRLEEVHRLTGWSPQFIETYLSNPNNFSAADWERVNRERKSMMEAFMPGQYVQKDETSSPAVQSAKQRRKKSAGQRRNWLPMK